MLSRSIGPDNGARLKISGSAFSRTILAGFPTTTQCGGTSLVTTLAGPTMAPLPIFTPPMINGVGAYPGVVFDNGEPRFAMLPVILSFRPITTPLNSVTFEPS